MVAMKSIRCILGFHDWGGELHMSCGCAWNKCLRCGKPASPEDKHRKQYHEDTCIAAREACMRCSCAPAPTILPTGLREVNDGE